MCPATMAPQSPSGLLDSKGSLAVTWIDEYDAGYNNDAGVKISNGVRVWDAASRGSTDGRVASLETLRFFYDKDTESATDECTLQFDVDFSYIANGTCANANVYLINPYGALDPCTCGGGWSYCDAQYAGNCSSCYKGGNNCSVCQELDLFELNTVTGDMQVTSHAGMFEADKQATDCNNAGDASGACWGTTADTVYPKGADAWRTARMTFEYVFTNSIGQVAMKIYDADGNMVRKFQPWIFFQYTDKDGKNHTFDLANADGVPIMVGINNTNKPGPSSSETTSSDYWDFTNLRGENIYVTSNVHTDTNLAGSPAYVPLD